MSEFEEKRKRLIQERKVAMPKSYQANYDRAVTGNSLRAPINAFCLECVCWHIKNEAYCICSQRVQACGRMNRLLLLGKISASLIPNHF